MKTNTQQTIIPIASSDNNSVLNKIKGSNNTINIQANIPTSFCAALIVEKEMQIERLQVENEMLREYIDHLKTLATARVQYIEKLINKKCP